MCVTTQAIGARRIKNYTTFMHDLLASTSGPRAVHDFAASACQIGQIRVDRLTFADAVDWVINSVESRRFKRPLFLFAVNAYVVGLAEESAEFKQAMVAADYCLPDGISVVLASRFIGERLPERVTGGDLMESLCGKAAEKGLSVYFLGGLPGAAEMTATLLKGRYPGLVVVGTCCPPFGFDLDPEYRRQLQATLERAKPDLLFVAFGAPKQELWIANNCPGLPVGAALGVGAALDTQSGLMRRAPEWTHKIGMEWLYRLAKEPKRLWRRYTFGNLKFAVIILTTLFCKRNRGSA